MLPFSPCTVAQDKLYRVTFFWTSVGVVHNQQSRLLLGCLDIVFCRKILQATSDPENSSLHPFIGHTFCKSQ